MLISVFFLLNENKSNQHRKCQELAIKITKTWDYCQKTENFSEIVTQRIFHLTLDWSVNYRMTKFQVWSALQLLHHSNRLFFYLSNNRRLSYLLLCTLPFLKVGFNFDCLPWLRHSQKNKNNSLFQIIALLINYYFKSALRNVKWHKDRATFQLNWSGIIIISVDRRIRQHISPKSTTLNEPAINVQQQKDE